MSIITHETAVKAAKWCVATIIFNCLVSLLFSAHAIVSAMCYLGWLGGTWFVVSKHLKKAEQEPVKKVVPDVDVACDRMCLIPDIDAVMHGTGYNWCWPDAVAINDIIVMDDKNRWHGTIQMDSNQRVYAVMAMIDGSQVRFVNKPYLYPKEKRMKEQNAPITSFFKEVLPDAVWSWTGEDLLSVTSEVRGLDNALVKVHYRKDGSVSSMIGENVKVRLVRSAKKAEKAEPVAEAMVKAAAAAPTETKVVTPDAAPAPAAATTEEKKSAAPSIAPEKIEGAIERDGKTSVLTAPEREEVRGDIDPINDENILAVDDVPPISTETAKMSAENIALFISRELEELANSALENGESSFVFKWPEGIQTITEAEYLAKELMNRCDIYQQITVDGDNQTLKFELFNPDAII